MKPMGLNEIREKYLAFFEGKGHMRLKSAPLLPKNDPSLLLINSGMAPLKPYFTGEVTPPSKRVTTCQKCIRTPDIERVGKTSRHGTFFEMLGNFSFGDYFKHEATAWAWEFVTKVMEIPEDRLYVSVYLDDDEAWDIWTKEVGVKESHMVRLGKEDNFWEIGAGPCGPCSEIYFDRGEQYSCGKADCAVGCDCDRYVEFWNLVFSQFKNDGHGNYENLEHKNIDTGMGLERLACIMQGVTSLFEVDTIKNIMQHISKIAGATYGNDNKTDVSLRVITDHIRSTVMMVCDGVIPSNEGRGYVLRRLLRRAARHGKLLGIDKPFLYEVCDTVISESAGAYPELIEKKEYIKKVIKTEEDRFDATINAGLNILDEMMQKYRSGDKTVMSGDDAFKLYDTFGFPIDLTVEILQENGMTVDEKRFSALMQEQKDRARAAREKMGDLGWTEGKVNLEDICGTEFVGYTDDKTEAEVKAIICEGEMLDTAPEGNDVIIIVDKTPFYAESGGQTADHGKMTGKNCALSVGNVIKTAGGKFLHAAKVEEGTVNVGDRLTLEIDKDRRRALMRAHSATHLLQYALRSVLGKHVEQAGSLVDADTVRFDFNHFSAMTSEEIIKVEQTVNEMILEGLGITIESMSMEDAKKRGAMALFSEKYGDVVRVVDMGNRSIELCGGTHLDNTAKCGLFKIVSEASVAAGVRRIEAVTGEKVLDAIYENANIISKAADAMKTAPKDLLRRAVQISEEIRELEKKNDKLENKLSKLEIINLFNFKKEVGGVDVIAAKMDDASVDSLRKMGDAARDRASKAVVVLATVTDEGKITFVCACGKEAVEKGAHAGNILREVAKIAGGSGGGKPDSAMAGGKDASKLEEALESVSSIVSGMLKDR